MTPFSGHCACISPGVPRARRRADYEHENLRTAIKRPTGDRGVDVIYEAVGDHFAEPAVRGMAWNGRYLLIGFAAGEVPRIALNLPLLKRTRRLRRRAFWDCGRSY